MDNADHRPFPSVAVQFNTRSMRLTGSCGFVVRSKKQKSRSVRRDVVTANNEAGLILPEGNLHGAVRADFDVRGFQIAMDDPELVRSLEGVGDLLRDWLRVGKSDPARWRPGL